AAHRRHHDRQRRRGGAPGPVRNAPVMSRLSLLPLALAACLLLPACERDAPARAPNHSDAGVGTLPRPEVGAGSGTGFDDDAPPPPPRASADADDAAIGDSGAPVANRPENDPDFALDTPPVSGSDSVAVPPAPPSGTNPAPAAPAEPGATE